MIGENIAVWAAEQRAESKAKGQIALVFDALEAKDITRDGARKLLLRLRAEGKVPVQMADEALKQLDQA